MWTRAGYIVAITAGACLWSWGSGCGSRSGLEPRCEDRVERECADDCGSGVQACFNGNWSACEVPVQVEVCQDECGGGERRCENGSFGECVVPPVTRECRTACGAGTETCEAGEWASCSAPRPLPPVIEAVVRDFSEAHPDFEMGRVGRDRGIVEQWLGADGKPGC